MWSRADVIGLFSINVVSFSPNVVLSGLSFSTNSVSNPRMLSARTVYVLSSLHVRIELKVASDMDDAIGPLNQSVSEGRLGKRLI
jgi:hypothetical protein